MSPMSVTLHATVFVTDAWITGYAGGKQQVQLIHRAVGPLRVRECADGSSFRLDVAWVEPRELAQLLFATWRPAARRRESKAA